MNLDEGLLATVYYLIFSEILFAFMKPKSLWIIPVWITTIILMFIICASIHC